MSALSAARERLEAYVADCVVRAQMQEPGPYLDGLKLRRLEEEVILAVRCETPPF